MIEQSVDAITKVVGSLSRAQLVEIITEMKRFVQTNPDCTCLVSRCVHFYAVFKVRIHVWTDARELLVGNPSLSHALLQIQMLFGLIQQHDIEQALVWPFWVGPPIWLRMSTFLLLLRKMLLYLNCTSRDLQFRPCTTCIFRVLCVSSSSPSVICLSSCGTLYCSVSPACRTLVLHHPL